VALGSDFDGSTTTGFDTAHIAAITDVLLARGMSEEDIAKVMGGNALRVLRAGLQPLAAAAPAA
jgi:microsomal dipeptidase-like Zn-dependent dipeptidase